MLVVSFGWGIAPLPPYSYVPAIQADLKSSLLIMRGPFIRLTGEGQTSLGY